MQKNEERKEESELKASLNQGERGEKKSFQKSEDLHCHESRVAIPSGCSPPNQRTTKYNSIPHFISPLYIHKLPGVLVVPNVHKIGENVLFTEGHVCLSHLLSSEHLHRHSHARAREHFLLFPRDGASECCPGAQASAQSTQANLSLCPHSHLSCYFPDENLVPGTLCSAPSPREGWWATQNRICLRQVSANLMNIVTL